MIMKYGFISFQSLCRRESDYSHLFNMSIDPYNKNAIIPAWWVSKCDISELRYFWINQCGFNFVVRFSHRL
jgi:hypothetical protein